jgi:peptidoglycan/LPS O-acetylase OafA/YrhL
MRDGGAVHSLPLMPQLDSLRAVAILAVLYTHYLPEKYWAFGVYWGELGVRLFFVLSGFLITSVLLRDLENSRSLKSTYFAFVSRRALRLYPVLLVALIVAAAVDVGHIRETFFWHAAYLTNFYIVKIDAWPSVVPHLWSLAVEEQFYLLWPIVIFFLPRRFIPSALIVLIVTSLAFRLAWHSAGLGDLGAWVLTPGSFDALAMGALLVFFKRVPMLFAVLGLVGLGLWLLMKSPWHESNWFLDKSEISFTAAAMFFVWIISRAAVGFGGIAGKVLDSKALQYIGTMSYGIYVLHGFVPYALMPWLRGGWQFHLLEMASTVLLASLSWHLLERPIMRVGRAKIADWQRSSGGGSNNEALAIGGPR